MNKYVLIFAIVSLIVTNLEASEGVRVKRSGTSTAQDSVITQELMAYLSSRADAALGLTTTYAPTTRRIPILVLLEKAMDIMQRACTVVPAGFLELSLEVFLKIQTQTFHVKEPYLSESEFIRIANSLNRCFLLGKTHNFVVNDTVVGQNGTVNVTARIQNTNCEIIASPPRGTDKVRIQGTVYNLTMDNDKRGYGYEPITETVWKSFLHCHSHCYGYFDEYYNDHHTFATAMMNLFTNEIQTIWKNGSFPYGKFVEPTPPVMIYGGLIGMHANLTENVDFCVAASRVGSAYPWLMNRPPFDETNTW